MSVLLLLLRTPSVKVVEQLKYVLFANRPPGSLHSYRSQVPWLCLHAILVEGCSWKRDKIAPSSWVPQLCEWKQEITVAFGGHHTIPYRFTFQDRFVWENQVAALINHNKTMFCSGVVPLSKTIAKMHSYLGVSKTHLHRYHLLYSSPSCHSHGCTFTGTFSMQPRFLLPTAVFFSYLISSNHDNSCKHSSIYPYSFPWLRIIR